MWGDDSHQRGWGLNPRGSKLSCEVPPRCGATFSQLEGGILTLGRQFTNTVTLRDESFSQRESRNKLLKLNCVRENV